MSYNLAFLAPVIFVMCVAAMIMTLNKYHSVRIAFAFVCGIYGFILLSFACNSTIELGLKTRVPSNSNFGGNKTYEGGAAYPDNLCVSCAKSGSAMGEARTDIYGYNARSELVLAAKNVEDAKEHEYGYDDI